MNIFVGNLSFDAKEIDVQRVFMGFGVVTSVAIVMEKKGKKSRGFGFVEMPDEQEALSAIDGLQGKEILGRPINVMVSLPKKPRSEHADERDKSQPQGMADSRSDNLLKRTGKYKQGKRSINYIKKRIDAGITTSVPERKYKANPMRWRKKPRWASSSQKPQAELKPGEKIESSQSSPWKKAEDGSKPWEKRRGESRPWKKTEGGAKPWRKSSDTRQQPSFRKRNSSVSHKK
jgi:RNA recognition motif-containing protein